MENRKLFECVEILLKTGGLNGCTFTVVLWKRGLKRCEKIDTTKNRQIQKISKLSSKIDVWRSSRAQRLDNYYGLRKTGSRPGTVPGKIRVTQNLFFARKGSPKGAFLEIPKIENGTKTGRWRQDRHRDPLKTLSRSNFERIRNINENLMGKWEICDEFVIHQNLLNCNKHGTKTSILQNYDSPVP